MKPDVGQGSLKNNLKGLNGAIEIHVKDGVLIVPNPGIWSCYFVTDEEESVVARIGFNLLYRGARGCPGHDGWFHPNSRTDG